MNLTNRQLYHFIFTFTIPFVICLLPRDAAEKFGTGAWIYLLAGSIVYAVFAGIVAYLQYSHEGQTIFEYAPAIVGKFITYCISIIYIMNYFLYTAFFIRLASQIVKTEVLVKTPMWSTMLLCVISIVYASSKGISNIGRMTEVIGIISVSTGVILLLIMMLQGDILNIKPIFNMISLQNYINQIPMSLYIFTGYEMITIIPFNKRNGKKSIWTAASSVIALGLLYTMLVEACYMALGVDDTKNYIYPLFSAMRMLNIKQLQIFKRIDLIYIMAWLSLVFSSLSIVLTTTVEYAKKFFVKTNRNIILIIIGILAFIVGLIPKTDNEVIQAGTYTSYYFAGITSTLVPLFILIIEKVKKHEKKMS